MADASGNHTTVVNIGLGDAFVLTESLTPSLMLLSNYLYLHTVPLSSRNQQIPSQHST